MLTPLIGVIGTALYTWRHGFHLWMPLLAIGMYLLVGFSICAGYHRFFSHKTYECSPLVQALYAFFGAMAAENSILTWSAGHREHHRYVDRDWDPYSIRRGFWWAHIVWIFYKEERGDEALAMVPDLQANPIVMWQHRWQKWILFAAGFGIPTAIGAMFGDPIAGLLWGGFLRIVIVHHTTFFVNSLAHALGEPRYNSEVSARDNWLVALLTLGEGYHSYHHRFPADFRNGIRWYQWDPSKWLIRGLRALGLASELRTATPPQIEQARMQAAIRAVDAAGASVSEQVRRRMREAVEHLETASALWRQHAQERVAGARLESMACIRRCREEWTDALRILRGDLEAA